MLPMTTVTALIGQAGGTLELPGLRVELPEGALSQDTELTLSLWEPSMPVWVEELRLGFRLDPEVELLVPARVSVEHGGWSEALALLQAEEEHWLPRPGERDDELWSASIVRSGELGLVTLEPTGCPCLGPDDLALLMEQTSDWTHTSWLSPPQAWLTLTREGRTVMLASDTLDRSCIVRVFDPADKEALAWFIQLFPELPLPPGPGAEVANSFEGSLLREPSEACFALVGKQAGVLPGVPLTLPTSGLEGPLLLSIDGSPRGPLVSGINDLGLLELGGATLSLSGAEEGLECTFSSGTDQLEVNADNSEIEAPVTCQR